MVVEISRESAVLALKLLLDDDTILRTVLKHSERSFGVKVYYFSEVSGQVHDISQEVGEVLQWRTDENVAVHIPANVVSLDPEAEVIEALGYQLGYRLGHQVL